MSYKEALEAAGARVISYEIFGSYQGDWWCLCSYNGEIGWVTGAFGSCSHCDAFEATFSCRNSKKLDYQERLKEFGLPYLETLMSQKDALKEASRNLEWDASCPEMIAFIQNSWKKRNK